MASVTPSTPKAPSPPEYISPAQMNAAMRQVGFKLVGSKPHSGFNGVTLWVHADRRGLEFTLPDPDYLLFDRLVYTIALARDIFSRATSFAKGTKPSEDGMRLELEPKS
jgi:hypothetical protein